MRELVIIGAATLGIIFLIFGLGFWLASASCASQSSKMGLEYSWGPLQDCMVSIDGRFMPLDSYKVMRIRPEQAK